MPQANNPHGLPFPLIKDDEIASMEERINIHQFNENAIRNTRSIGDLAGLSTIGIHLVRLEQGRDSTEFHSHQCDEEFVYILSGAGMAEIGDESFEVGSGDFMGFPRNSPAHNMHNPNREDLVYLMGGSRSDLDICDYPRINRRMFRVNGIKTFVDMNDLHSVNSATGNTDDDMVGRNDSPKDAN